MASSPPVSGGEPFRLGGQEECSQERTGTLWRGRLRRRASWQGTEDRVGGESAYNMFNNVEDSSEVTGGCEEED